MNVDKMRHAVQRSADGYEQRERQLWLASLDPEHRRIHEHPMFLGCGRCIQANADRLAQTLAEATARLNARHAQRMTLPSRT